jgi:hypothetical protein
MLKFPIEIYLQSTPLFDDQFFEQLNNIWYEWRQHFAQQKIVMGYWQPPPQAFIKGYLFD